MASERNPSKQSDDIEVVLRDGAVFHVANDEDRRPGDQLLIAKDQDNLLHCLARYVFAGEVWNPGGEPGRKSLCPVREV